MKSSIFDTLTNQYSLTKTLRFELKPTPETKILLAKKNLLGKNPVETDQEIADLYRKELKPIFDLLHEKFIDDSLSKTSLSEEKMKKVYALQLKLKELNKNKTENLQEIKNVEEEFQKIQSDLRTEIVENFDKTAENWYANLNGKNTGQKDKNNKKELVIKFKKKSVEFLKEENVLNLLLHFYPEKAEEIKKFFGFFTYFSGFNTNRENYYSKEAKATSISNRIINKNLIIFFANRDIFLEAKKKFERLSEFEDLFRIENFNLHLGQQGIEEYNERLGEIKSLINLEYNQKPENKKTPIKGFKKLEKQIGCRPKNLREEKNNSLLPYLEKIGLGFQIKKNEKGEYQIWQTMNFLIEELIEKKDSSKSKLDSLISGYNNFFENWQDYSLEEIWFRKEALNTISSRWFGGGNWFLISKVLSLIGVGKIDKGEYKIPDFVSLSEIKSALEILERGIDFDIKNNRKNIPSQENKLYAYKAGNLFKQDEKYKQCFKDSLFETLLTIWQMEINEKYRQIFFQHKTKSSDGKDEIRNAFLDEFKKHRQEIFSKDKRIDNRSVHVETVKNLVEEGFLGILRLTKYHSLQKKGELAPNPVDPKFYDFLNNFWENNFIIDYHKALQSTLTKKSYSEEKIKLNFEKGTLLNGFVESKTEKSNAGTQYGAYLFRKKIDQEKYDYFLGLTKNSKLFSFYNEQDKKEEETDFERLNYYQLKLNSIYGSSYDGDYQEDKKNLSEKELIEKIKKTLKKYEKKVPRIEEIVKKEISSIKEMRTILDDIVKDKVFIFKKVTREQFDLAYKSEKDFYLFQIVNKDFSRKNIDSRENIHSIYFKNLISDKQNVFDLGSGEIFFRKSSIEKEVDKKRSEKARKEIIELKRFTENKYLLHLSTLINYKQKKKVKEFTEGINDFISKNYKNINIIGIDRGEKHLLYYSVINSKGEIIDQGSLNEIGGFDYNEALSKRSSDMMEARKNWETIGNIKNFKEGYLSQAVNKIYELVIEHNGLVIMEDLNSEFKAKRTAKVEKSIYKKFELALAKKLGHLVLKDRQPTEPGGVLNAYQLTPLIQAGKIGMFEKQKQWGVILYARANYTSITDPLTGWRKHIYLSNTDNLEKIKNLFNPENKQGVKIEFNTEKNCFCFQYTDENNFNWELFAFDGLERFWWDKDKENEDKTRGKVETFDLHNEFEEIFFNLDKSKSINQQLFSNEKFNWKKLIFLWNLLNQIRNSCRIKREGIEDKIDFIQSPVYSEKISGFYDSRKAESIEKETGIKVPKDGDANGAYNIARKGLILAKRIKDNPEKPDLYIYDSDWSNIATEWEKHFHS